MNNNVSIWGDSLLLGVLYSDSRYFVNKGFTEEIARSLNIGILNHSRFGITTEKAVRLFDCNTEYGAAVIEYGGNDCNFNWEQVAREPEKEHAPAVPLSLFCRNIEHMITACKQKRCNVIITTLPPLVPERFFDFITKKGLSRQNILHWLGDIGHIYRHHERYNAALVMLAKKHNCMIADIRDSFLKHKNYGDLICEDGMHPNIHGQRVIKDTFTEFYNDVYKN